MSTQEIQNATIDSIGVGSEDHGILTMFIRISGDGWGVGIGGYALDQYDKAKKRRVGSALLADAVIRLCEVFEVGDIFKLIGKPCRAVTSGLGGRCHRIGHFTKDKWFDWEELTADYTKGAS